MSEALQWTAAIVVLAAFALSQTGSWAVRSYRYLVCNLLGGAEQVPHSFTSTLRSLASAQARFMLDRDEDASGERSLLPRGCVCPGQQSAS
jgi:hypothetical protein